MAKFVSHIGEKGEIFYDDTGAPVWFKAEMHGDIKTPVLLFPTVYTLWKFPETLPIIWTSSYAIEKLINGADLMVPGLIVPPGGMPDLKRGDIVAVCCPGSLGAQAVGVLTFDTKDVRSVAGAKGKAVLIAHTYKDHLWESGSKEGPPEITGEHAADVEDTSGEQPVADSAHSEHHEAAEYRGQGDEVTAAEMDALLMNALKQVMATVLDSEHAAGLLPLNASTLYSNYMVPNAPRGITLDIKRSTYKKLAKFLKAAEKLGLIKLKDIRGELHIKVLEWSHREMTGFEPYRVVRAKGGDRPSGQTAESGGASKNSGGSSGSAGMIQIIELLKPSRDLVPLFDDVGARSESGFFSRQEARGVLEQYIKKHELVNPNSPRMIKLDHCVCDGLLAKDEYSKLSEMARDKLHGRLQEKMTLYTQIVVPGRAPGAPKIGNPAAVEIACEKKMGSKILTRIAGLEAYDIDPAGVAKDLRTMCASSTGVDPIPGKKNAQSVHVQGHQVAAVSKLLEKRGIPAHLLKVTDKTGKAPKKQGGGRAAT
ncbi:hypothetical protein LPJ53_005302 [Coemansia erecta]|uniref:Eukaryotic translation initiation factor SUI1 family protein n=1 Tax=Coemansia erecta TaxID=147472 RepID=A0A9W8CQ02_9FUNG|nr:hypothetical protein LPJ53_005302 [Coemansia erecta]